MEMKKTKSVRFKKLLDDVGIPTLYLPYNPKSDRKFLKALAETHVLSVKQAASGKAAFGAVGYKFEKNVSILVFPNSLEDFVGMRVVGIDLSAVSGTSTGGRISKSKAKSEKEAKSEKPRVVKSKDKASRARKSKTEAVHAQPVRAKENKKIRRTEKSETKAETRLFVAEVTFAAQYTRKIRVRARSLGEAKKAVSSQAKGATPDFSDAETNIKIGRIQKL